METSMIAYITLAAVTIGTIAAIITVIRDFIKSKRRVTLTTIKVVYEKNNKIVHGPGNESVSFIVVNNMMHAINIVKIGYIESNGMRHVISLSAFGFPSIGQIPVECESRKILEMDKEWVSILKNKDFRYAYIEDTLGNTYKGKIQEDIRQIFFK
jgi:hypothetical protein